MTDKEKIKEEIKRRISNLEQLGDREHIKKYFAEQFRFIEVYEGLIKFIDSLPEEYNEDLDKLVISLEETIGTSPHSREVIKEHLQKAVDWQKKKDKETIKLAEDHTMLAGMNKMKEEIMKDAVEGIVGGHTDIPAFINLEIEHKPNVKVGDKVKIVVLKTE